MYLEDMKRLAFSKGEGLWQFFCKNGFYSKAILCLCPEDLK
jgi:hypothetical protein